MKKGKILQLSESLISLCKDEEKLKTEVNEIVNVVEKRIGDTSQMSQEKIRDTIRSEAFANGFREDMLLPA